MTFLGRKSVVVGYFQAIHPNKTIIHKFFVTEVLQLYLILCKELNNRVTNYEDLWFLFLCLGNKSFMLHHTH